MATNYSMVGQVEMEPDWADFLRSKVNSFIKWDLVRFFHDNPHTRDTADNIARYIGRDARTITYEIQELAKSGVLQVDEISGVKVYKYTADDATRSLIARFVAACHDREFRVKAIYHVIRGMQFSPGHDF